MKTTKKPAITLFLVLVLTLSTLFTFQAQAASPSHDLTGTWTWNYYYGSGTYTHSMIITSFNTVTGDFSGNGYYLANPAYTWDVTGNVDGDTVTFTIDYTGQNPTYYVNAEGTISATGSSMSGDATAPGQTATWDATRDAYTITTIVDGMGSITPSGPIFVNPGADQTFTITPDLGYHIDDVLVDTVSVGVVSSYTFSNVQADHEIEAVFEINIEVTLPLGVEAKLFVLPGAPPCVPPLPGIGPTPYFVIQIVSGSLTESVEVCILYDDSGLTDEQESNLRLYISNCVDFNKDGTINGIDVSLIKKAVKKGLLVSDVGVSFDVNNDGIVDDVDVDIVKQYARKGLIVNPGRNIVGNQARLPYIDITTYIDLENNRIYGETSHFSIFGVRW